MEVTGSRTPCRRRSRHPARRACRQVMVVRPCHAPPWSGQPVPVSPLRTASNRAFVGSSGLSLYVSLMLLMPWSAP